MTDRWIVSDAVRSCPADFRSVTTEPIPEVTIRIGPAPRRLVFRGPTLFAAIETARLAHRQLHGSDFPPIYTRAAGPSASIVWWDGVISPRVDVDDASLKRAASRYLEEIYDARRCIRITTASV